MKRTSLLGAASAALLLSASTAWAIDCPPGTTAQLPDAQTTGSTASDGNGGITKDGSLAPLQGADGTTTVPGAGDASGAAAATSTLPDAGSDQAATSTMPATGSDAATGDQAASPPLPSDGAAPGADASTDTADAGGVAKDGRTMPLADGAGGGSADVAMSDQDVAAQQQGQQTAAAAAGQGECM